MFWHICVVAWHETTVKIEWDLFPGSCDIFSPLALSFDVRPLTMVIALTLVLGSRERKYYACLGPGHMAHAL